jgi:hypothetical protein
MSLPLSRNAPAVRQSPGNRDKDKKAGIEA